MRAARRLNTAAGVLAASVLADSGLEHYRGSFHNKGMFAPLVTAALSIAVSAHGTRDERPAAHAVRDAAYVLAAATGTAGMGFHLYNIGKRPGGFSWLNLFYAAPIGAPAALILSGLLGWCAERVRESRRPALLGVPAGRAAAAVASAGLFGTVGEAALLHFRGAFQDPFMVLPVTVPPVAATLLAGAIAAPQRPHRAARKWLGATALLGVLGMGFHALGVARNMGGWRNWSQNLLNGPPLPAPPSFTGLALAGLAALDLLGERRRG